MNKEKSDIFLIDGNSLCYRAYYAIPQLSTSKGVPTNAVYGFIAMIRKIMKDYSPKSVLVAFDLPGETERHKKYEKYKENRSPMPEDLVSQMDTIKSVVEAYRMPIFEKTGYEADDVIATLTRRALKKGFNVTIVTGDKDALQLVGDRVKVLSPHPVGDKLYDAEGVVEKFGVPPERMTDLMALMGDSSDNIPGVKGIGRVTAGKLIREFGSLEKVYDDLQSVLPVSVRKKLEEGRESAFLSRDLAILDHDVPLGDEKIPASLEEPDSDSLREIFREMEFTKLLKELEVPEVPSVKMTVLSTIEDLKKMVSSAVKSPVVSIRADNGLVGYALSFSEGEVFYADLEKNAAFREEALKALSTVAGARGVVKAGHDIKRDMRLFGKAGVEIKMPFFDVMMADYLLDPSFSGYSLADIAARHGMALTSDKSSSRAKSGGEDLVEDLLAEKDILKACMMCDAVFRLTGPLEKGLKEKELYSLFRDVEMPLVEVLADMETAGVKLDLDLLKQGAERIEEELASLVRKAYALAGEEFNINSPKQIQDILYVKLSLPAGKKIKTGRSTDEEALKKLSKLHELPGKILEYRRLSKLKTGYYDSILTFTDTKDAMLHAKFNQAVTSTGRLSSSEPNLQNIPVKTEVGREIRRAFKPRKIENVLVAADYSQVELRVLAHLSADPMLTGAFKEELDVHVFTASLIYGCDMEKVTYEMRSAAKTVNFGIIYGMGAFGLAGALGIPVKEAEDFISAYFSRYSGINDFISKTIDRTRKDGYVTTLFGRRRYLPGITSLNDKVRSFAERAAVNTAVQGTAADIIKMAMIKCREKFMGTGTTMIIQVHDELVFDTPKKTYKEDASDIRKIMEEVVSLKVPLRVNVESGPNWRDMEPVEC